MELSIEESLLQRGQVDRYPAAFFSFFFSLDYGRRDATRFFVATSQRMHTFTHKRCLSFSAD